MASCALAREAFLYLYFKQEIHRKGTMIQMPFNGFSGICEAIVFGIVVIGNSAGKMAGAGSSADSNIVFVFHINLIHILSLLKLLWIL
jgi:hypothetical protein